MSSNLSCADVRTRFAPSPTGYLHIGGARTALFSWAYARHFGGSMVLRIEDTDVERSTPEAVQAILDGLSWLGLHPDEGPFYQMQRMPRYKEVIAQMLASGSAYACYTSSAELDALREAQRERGEKPRYDGRWRPEPGKSLPTVPEGVAPVIRFRNPTDGIVAWDDLVKGRIEISNSELDDFIIARADGTPTYNFCVVVDDLDMRISHVIRGDDHVNNTPRQINLLLALGGVLPQYGHLSMILGSDGQKLSKRHGAVGVMQYHEMGYLPDAVINYLARLGWSHGDEEVFSREQFVEWFDLNNITPSAAQFNTEKLNWLNAHYIRAASVESLANDLRARLIKDAVPIDELPSLTAIVELYRERATSMLDFVGAAKLMYAPPIPDEENTTKHLGEGAATALMQLRQNFAGLSEWTAEQTGTAIKQTVAELNLKMPKVAMPLRLALMGTTQTPEIGALVAVLGRQRVGERIGQTLQRLGG